jgi:hypothetical protein
MRHVRILQPNTSVQLVLFGMQNRTLGPYNAVLQTTSVEEWHASLACDAHLCNVFS